MSVLLDHDANVDAADRSGRTPLMEAAHREQHEIAKLLLGKGADVHLTDEGGQTAADTAARGGATKVASLLAAVGGNPNKSDKTEGTGSELQQPQSEFDLRKLLATSPGGLPIWSVYTEDTYDHDHWHVASFVSAQAAERCRKAQPTNYQKSWVNRSVITCRDDCVSSEIWWSLCESHGEY